MKTALVTGSAGLIGSAAARLFYEKGYDIVGVDNDMRAYFFGIEASTAQNLDWLKGHCGNHYSHYSADIRDEGAMRKIFQERPFDIIIHTAAQPSHDWASREPITDFSINATGTLVLLELYRKFSPAATFIFTSTNKVYGDTPNRFPLEERETRWEIQPGHHYENGIDESLSIDSSVHSIFGVSKVAADTLVQEYGKYFGLNTAVFRGGCVTGSAHSATELHGFLAYLVKCVATQKPYTIFGYKGKQVRDNIHASDLVNMFWHFHQKPRPGEVYNAGGGRHANISMMEALEKAGMFLKMKPQVTYTEEPRIGDHIWYISDLSKFRAHYPDWQLTYDIDQILKNLCSAYTHEI
jgi:CDP-paratose 2-epimerase